MGLGKTVTTLTAINDLMFDYCEISTSLVIAPKRVVESVWQEEAANWEHLRHLKFSKVIGSTQKRAEALKKKADIYLISRDNIAWLCSYFSGYLPFDLICIDELSSFKSYKSERFKALRMTRPYFKRFIGLTGTPSPNGLIDLWPQIYLMDMGERLEKTISSYRAKYFRPGKTNGHVVYSYKPLDYSEKLIPTKISDICISLRAEDYIKLPPRTDNYIKIDMSEDLARKYTEFEKHNILELMGERESSGYKEISAVNAASLSNKLLQFANGAVYDENRDVFPIHSLKLDALKEIVEDANGQPVLVAWVFQFDRDRILEALERYSPRELKTKKDIDEWNRGEVQVMLAHPASAGHGLNLQAGGCIIVWFGLTWSLELYQQFNARLYRQGQRQNVIINHLVINNTHDMDVISALKSKNRTQDALMNSIKAKVEKYMDLNKTYL
jgi:SNF2 family DNA or RNA helicase